MHLSLCLPAVYVDVTQTNVCRHKVHQFPSNPSLLYFYFYTYGTHKSSPTLFHISYFIFAVSEVGQFKGISILISLPQHSWGPKRDFCLQPYLSLILLSNCLIFLYKPVTPNMPTMGSKTPSSQNFQKFISSTSWKL